MNRFLHFLRTIGVVAGAAALQTAEHELPPFLSQVIASLVPMMASRAVPDRNEITAALEQALAEHGIVADVTPAMIDSAIASISKLHESANHANDVHAAAVEQHDRAALTVAASATGGRPAPAAPSSAPATAKPEGGGE